ncbi:helix-turn-helix domain-containing protein [Anaeromyxobacter sp. Red801]|uniref:helix-turn-helix domain-containing protein n=1 Tax=Anaeromyxobacter sp. Red801 TaxID=3411632 RepID=UPI003BA0E9B9
MDDGPDGIETLWDARDVARYLKVSRSWVYQKAEAGLLPYLKVGGLVRFVPERIRAFALGSGTPTAKRVLASPVRVGAGVEQFGTRKQT